MSSDNSSIKQLVVEAVQQELLEQTRKNIHLFINGQEVAYGSSEHISDLKQTLEGLERVRDCYKAGSSSRMVFSHACSRLKKVLERLSPAPSTSSSP